MTATSLRALARPEAAGLRLEGGELLAFAIPATFFVQLHLVGQLYMPEVLLAAVLPPLLVARKESLRRHVPPAFVVLTLVWLYGQIATDVYRGTSIGNLARGWANITFTLVDFAAIALLLEGRARRCLLFTAGLAAGFFLDFFINHNDYGYPWKFGVGEPVSIAIVLVACLRPVRRIPFLSGVVVGAAAVLNLVYDFRSLALILFSAAVYLLFVDGSRRRGQVALGTVLRLALVTGLGALAFALTYSYAARTGALGSRAQQQYTVQSQSPYGIIVGGRPEFQASIHAIADSPLLGHGSWPVDRKYLKYLESAGIENFSPWTQAGLIPTHSAVAGAWVNAGILGVPIWIWVVSLSVLALIRGVGTNDRLLPLFAFAAVSLGWAVPFSPYAGPNRLVDMSYVVLVVFGIDRARAAAPEVER